MANDYPQTANQVLARVDEDHNYNHAPIDMNSTGGIQKAIERNWQAIRALADYVDGNVRQADGTVTDKSGKVIDPVTGDVAREQPDPVKTEPQPLQPAV